jgi:uncharacterized Zn finger protein
MPIRAAPPKRRPAADASAIRAATIYCEVCGAATPHRVLRVTAASSGGVEGIARCNTCRWTHPFQEIPPVRREIWVVRSEGPSSTRRRVSVPPDLELQLHEPFPGLEPPAIVRRIEGHDGATLRVARPAQIATVWAVPDRPPGIPVSLIFGRITRAERWAPDPGVVVTVGDPLEIDGYPTFVVGFRGRARTWRRPGDSLPAAEVTRVYARLTDRPPAGSSGWSTARETPSSRASSTSRVVRSRSGPGRRIARIVPRVRRARGGATVQ